MYFLFNFFIKDKKYFIKRYGNIYIFIIYYIYDIY